MIYKDFIAEAAQKMMATGLVEIRKEADNMPLSSLENAVSGLAVDSVAAARKLAEALEADFNVEKVDGGIRRYAEGETFFDNYVNWSKTK